MKRIAAIICTIALTFSLTGCIYTEDDIDEARQDGYNEGYEVGYEEGYSAAEDSYEDNYDSGYLGPYTGEYDYDDTEYSVFVTPSGEKYHRNGCQYISGKYNLKIYASADEAANDGYEPCSVCNPY